MEFLDKLQQMIVTEVSNLDKSCLDCDRHGRLFTCGHACEVRLNLLRYLAIGHATIVAKSANLNTYDGCFKRINKIVERLL